MPKCKNSPTGTYKGTEPSPKGRGYCAKGEKVNKKMKGNDGKMWIISETKTGLKRWIKFTNNKINSTKNSKKVTKTKQEKTKIKRPKNILSPTLLKYHKKAIAKKSNPKKTKKQSNPKKTKKKSKRKSKIIDTMKNKYYNDNIQAESDLLYSKILQAGLEKLFKVKIKKNTKDKIYEFIIERKKKYPDYNIIRNINLLSVHGSKNIENKKVSKKNFTQMKKTNKFIYIIDDIGQNKITLDITIAGDDKLHMWIDLSKVYNI